MNIPKITTKLFPAGHSFSDAIVKKSPFLQQQQTKYLQKLSREDLLATEVPKIVKGESQVFNSMDELDKAIKTSKSSKIKMFFENCRIAANELLEGAATKMAAIANKFKK